MNRKSKKSPVSYIMNAKYIIPLNKSNIIKTKHNS